MPKVNLTHLEAALLYAFFASIVLGITTKKSDRDRLHYGAYCFGCFVAALFGIGWLMYIGHR
jgi:putative Mn2+ efflux pump MntP